MKLFNRFPLRTMIFEPRAGGNYSVSFDRIGLFRKKIGIGHEYRLKKRKHTLDEQQYKTIIEKDKMRLIFLWNPSQGIYQPMEVNQKMIDVSEIQWKEFFMSNVERTFTIFMRKGWFEKYKEIILWITFGVLMIIAFMVARQDLISVIQQAQQAVGSAVSTVSQVTPPI